MKMAAVASTVRAVIPLKHFQEKHALAKAGSGIRFSVRECDQARMLERFLAPIHVQPLHRSRAVRRRADQANIASISCWETWPESPLSLGPLVSLLSASRSAGVAGA